jgi:hypothetical protein
MAMGDYLIQVRPEGNKFLAKVLAETSWDQREGVSYDVIGVALDADKNDAIYNAVQEAFFS